MSFYETVIRELAAKGIPQDKARSIVELADHARKQAVDAVMRVSDSATDDTKVEVLLVSLALLDMHLERMKEEVDKVVKLLTAGRL